MTLACDGDGALSRRCWRTIHARTAVSEARTRTKPGAPTKPKLYLTCGFYVRCLRQEISRTRREKHASYAEYYDGPSLEVFEVFGSESMVGLFFDRTHQSTETVGSTEYTRSTYAPGGGGGEVRTVACKCCSSSVQVLLFQAGGPRARAWKLSSATRKAARNHHLYWSIVALLLYSQKRPTTHGDIHAGLLNERVDQLHQLGWMQVRREKAGKVGPFRWKQLVLHRLVQKFLQGVVVLLVLSLRYGVVLCGGARNRRERVSAHSTSSCINMLERRSLTEENGGGGSKESVVRLSVAVGRSASP